MLVSDFIGIISITLGIIIIKLINTKGGEIMENSSNAQRCDIVERYCPKRKQNVKMMRTQGVNTSFKCMNYADCKEKKDVLCAHHEQH